jgi:hypothetical protein
MGKVRSILFISAMLGLIALAGAAGAEVKGTYLYTCLISRSHPHEFRKSHTRYNPERGLCYYRGPHQGL